MAHPFPNNYQTYKTYGLRHMFTVAQGVGPGMQNDPDDVVMVQFMLNAILMRDQLRLDGIYGRKTAAKIKAFQQKCFGSGNAVDGRIAKIDSSWPDNLRSGKRAPTMVALNLHYKDADPTGYANWLPHAIEPLGKPAAA